MKVTIVGAGNMGRGIGTRVLAGGHAVEIVDRVGGGHGASTRTFADVTTGQTSSPPPVR
jgi:3-hydroxyacyl-CoA dehydrogenase